MAKSRKKRIEHVEEQEVEQIAIQEEVAIETEVAIEPEVAEQTEELSEVEVEVKNIENEKEAILRRIKENAANHGQEYFDKAKKNGCDYSAFGDWQKQYAQMMHGLFNLKERNILDVGGAYGALAHAMSKHGAKKVVCTDISRYAVDAKKFAGIEYVCAPLQHMKNIGDGAFDLIHISHVFEHIDEVDHERCVREISRMLVKNGNCIILGNYSKIDTLKSYFEKYMKCEFQTVNPENDKHGFFKNYNWKYLVVVKK